MRDAESAQTNFRFAAPSGGAFITNFPPRTRRGTRKGRNCSGMIVGFNLDRNMNGFFVVSVGPVLWVGEETPCRRAFYNRRVIMVGHQRVLPILGVRVTYHFERGAALFFTIQRPVGVENLVPAVL